MKEPSGIKTLSAKEQELVRQCIRASVEGPFFPEEEFSTIFGVTRSEAAEVLSQWPKVDESNDVVHMTINNSLNNLLGYPHGLHDNWSEYIEATGQEIAAVFAKWRGKRPGSFFDGMA